MLGQFGGPGLAAAAAQAVPLLCEVIQAGDSRALSQKCLMLFYLGDPGWGQQSSGEYKSNGERNQRSHQDPTVQWLCC